MAAQNESGHDVFNINHTYHLEQIKQQNNYAYLTDLTAAQFFAAENCDYVIAPERFFPMQYSIALQLNSAYKDEVTQ